MVLRLALFLGVFLTLTTVLHVYLYRRLIRDTTTRPGLRRAGKGVIAGLWAVVVLGGPVNAVLGSSVTEALATGTWVWVGVVVYLWLTLALAGSVLLVLRKTPWGRGVRTVPAGVPDPGGPHSPERRLFLSRAVAGGALAATTGVSSYGVWRAYTPPEIEEVVIRLKRLPKALDGFTIVQVSDIHVGPLVRRQFMDDMVARCNALKPDLMAITGDLVDGNVATLGHSVAALANLRSRHGSYFITGNHEYYSGDLEWSAELERQGVQVLRNRTVRIGDAAASFDLVGVDDWIGQEGRRYDLDAALAGAAPDRTRVLLAHQPAHFKEATAQGVDLQLSGHTHGGQMFPFNLLVPLQWEHFAGHYTHGEGQIYVSRGTGFWGPPLRVGSPPEISRIVLVAA